MGTCELLRRFAKIVKRCYAAKLMCQSGTCSVHIHHRIFVCKYVFSLECFLQNLLAGFVGEFFHHLLTGFVGFFYLISADTFTSPQAHAVVSAMWVVLPCISVSSAIAEGHIVIA